MRNVECVRPDYESECKRLTELNHQLTAKISDIKYRNESLEKELHLMKVQLDLVYMIFGNK